MPHGLQLNTDFRYPSTGRSANQVLTFSALGILTPAPAPGAIAALPKACRHDDLTQPLELRARSWLDSNCAACHRPGGANANWDARLTTPLASANILNGPVKKSQAIAGEAALRPHDPERSLIHVRSASLEPTQIMPPLGKALNDTAGLETVRAWIDSMDPAGDTTTGLKATYFNDQTLTTPVFSRTDGPLSLIWGNGSPDARIGVNNFSAHWTGRLLPDATGNFILHGISDEGLRVWVNGALVIDDWVAHTQRDRLSAALSFTQGVAVNLRIEYYEIAGDARIELAWDPPGARARTPIPAANLLFPRPENRPPTAVNDSLSAVRGGRAVSIPVVANDFDFEGNMAPASVKIVKEPAFGKVVAGAAGTFSYEATAGSKATADQFTYQVSDSNGALSNEALITDGLEPLLLSSLEAVRTRLASSPWPKGLQSSAPLFAKTESVRAIKSRVAGVVGVRVEEIFQEIRLVHADGASGAGGCFAAPEDAPGALGLGHLESVAGRGVSVRVGGFHGHQTRF